MKLAVEDYEDRSGWTDIGLTVDRIQTMAESRLRAARLYDATARTYLYVNVNVVGRGVSLSVEYNKLGLIRFRGHVPKGGYDVPNGSNHTSAVTPAIQ